MALLRRNVLIFHSGALGDFVLSWPLAMGLGRIFAQSRIIFVTASQKGQLAERLLRLEATDAEAGWHTLFAPGAEGLPEKPAKLLAGAQAIYFFGEPSATWLANVRRLNDTAKLVTLNPTPPPDSASHQSDFVLHQLAPHPAEHAAMEQMLKSARARGVGFVRTAGSVTVIHPGSGSREKCWPVDRFVEVAARLQAAGKPVRFVIGEVEKERWTDADVQRLESSADLRCPGNSLELVGALADARAFLGNDSGPGHLAAMLGVPTVCLFGPTSPAVWQPLGPTVTVLSAETLDAITVGQVVGALVTTSSSRADSVPLARYSGRGLG